MTESQTVQSQFNNFGPYPIDGYGANAVLNVKVRWDDECGNGHNTFAITGQVSRPGGKDFVACGCLHEEITKAAPHLAPYIKWHLCGPDGPLHYISNTVYHAGDRDCWGYRKGEPMRTQYHVRPPGGSGLLVTWPEDKDRILGPKIQTYNTKEEAQSVADAAGGEVVVWVIESSAGKQPDLDTARKCAIWPDATDEDLTAPGLEDRLNARLPALLQEFRKNVESLGFTW